MEVWQITKSVTSFQTETLNLEWLKLRPFPRFIINLVDDEIEWLEDFEGADQEELELEVATLIDQASEFYDREMKHYETE